MKNLEKEIMGIEITDELILIQKRYKYLSDLYDKYEEMIDVVNAFEDTLYFNEDVKEGKDSKAITALIKLQNSVYKEMREISEKLSRELFLSRMVRGAIMIKTLK